MVFCFFFSFFFSFFVCFFFFGSSSPATCTPGSSGTAGRDPGSFVRALGKREGEKALLPGLTELFEADGVSATGTYNCCRLRSEAAGSSMPGPGEALALALLSAPPPRVSSLPNPWAWWLGFSPPRRARLPAAACGAQKEDFLLCEVIGAVWVQVSRSWSEQAGPGGSLGPGVRAQLTLDPRFLLAPSHSFLNTQLCLDATTHWQRHRPSPALALGAKTLLSPALPPSTLQWLQEMAPDSAPDPILSSLPFKSHSKAMQGTRSALPLALSTPSMSKTRL